MVDYASYVIIDIMMGHKWLSIKMTCESDMKSFSEKLRVHYFVIMQLKSK